MGPSTQPVSSACRYGLESVLSLTYDPRNIEDLDSRGPDHFWDAARYFVSRERHFEHSEPIDGAWGYEGAPFEDDEEELDPETVISSTPASASSLLSSAIRARC